MNQPAPMIVRSPGEVVIKTIKDIQPLEERLAKFPGSLKGKSKKKETIAWLTAGIQELEQGLPNPGLQSHLTHEDKRATERVLLWKILRTFIENDGVFITRTRMLVSQIPKTKPGTIDSDLTKMNPAMGAGGANFRGPRDRLIGVSVSVKQGPYKAHIGVVKDVNGSVARVELQTGNKVITIDKSKLWRRKCVYILFASHTI